MPLHALMKLVLATAFEFSSSRRQSFAEAVRDYIGRSTRYADAELREFQDESRLLDWVEAAARRTRPMLMIADSQGEQLDSEAIAAMVGRFRDSGVQTLVMAVGPANGWSGQGRKRADRIVAFGRVTLPHELAAVVAAEQIYRAFTILAGHPYHCGH